MCEQKHYQGTTKIADLTRAPEEVTEAQAERATGGWAGSERFCQNNLVPTDLVPDLRQGELQTR